MSRENNIGFNSIMVRLNKGIQSADGQSVLDWNAEWIGELRDKFFAIIAKELGIKQHTAEFKRFEKEFYPFIEND